jgi:hypothetical protein
MCVLPSLSLLSPPPKKNAESVAPKMKKKIPFNLIVWGPEKTPKIFPSWAGFGVLAENSIGWLGNFSPKIFR